jgi:hypothetical protein
MQKPTKSQGPTEFFKDFDF